MHHWFEIKLNRLLVAKKKQDSQLLVCTFTKHIAPLLWTEEKNMHASIYIHKCVAEKGKCREYDPDAQHA